MVADALKSPSITNLDAAPVVTNTTGVGAPGSVRESSDNVTPTAAGLADTGSKFKMVRLPMYAKVKELLLFADAALDTNGAPTLKVDVGAYYSDSTVDGTPVALQGTSISVNCFAAALVYGAAGNVNGIRADAAWTQAKKNKPLWDALGLTSNPGGFVDVVVAVNTGAATGASQPLGISVKHVA